MNTLKFKNEILVVPHIKELGISIPTEGPEYERAVATHQAAESYIGFHRQRLPLSMA